MFTLLILSAAFTQFDCVCHMNTGLTRGKANYLISVTVMKNFQLTTLSNGLQGLLADFCRLPISEHNTFEGVFLWINA